jgi:alkylation response protein AidB-like acyl-CoA dehydrogenase
MWEFETDDAYQMDLDWAAKFIRDEIEPLQYVLDDPLDLKDPLRNALIRPLQEKVRDRGLWATHLGPELGGKGHGQVKLALLNEILGGVPLAPIIFGCQAPDTGNPEILAHCGSDEQPLLVSGLCAVAYGRRRPTAVQPLRQGREHRRAAGRDGVARPVHCRECFAHPA